MTFEVERKIPLSSEEYKSIQAYLIQKELKPHRKYNNDIYFAPVNLNDDEIDLQHTPIVRVRFREGICEVNFKRRIDYSTLNVNKEEEFTITDYRAFRTFLSYIGYRRLVRKVKDAEVYSYKGITIELNRISGLGMFLECEILVDSKYDVQHAVARIDKLFDELQVSQIPPETRLYLELLFKQ
jgi:predicted adenylyl cyclase CyaB